MLESSYNYNHKSFQYFKTQDLIKKTKGIRIILLYFEFEKRVQKAKIKCGSTIGQL